jgi:hypothetical protein
MIFLCSCMKSCKISTKNHACLRVQKPLEMYWMHAKIYSVTGRIRTWKTFFCSASSANKNLVCRVHLPKATIQLSKAGTSPPFFAHTSWNSLVAFKTPSPTFFVPRGGLEFVKKVSRKKARGWCIVLLRLGDTPQKICGGGGSGPKAASATARSCPDNTLCSSEEKNACLTLDWKTTQTHSKPRATYYFF